MRPDIQRGAVSGHRRWAASGVPFLVEAERGVTQPAMPWWIGYFMVAPTSGEPRLSVVDIEVGSAMSFELRQSVRLFVLGHSHHSSAVVVFLCSIASGQKRSNTPSRSASHPAGGRAMRRCVHSTTHTPPSGIARYSGVWCIWWQYARNYLAWARRDFCSTVLTTSVPIPANPARHWPIVTCSLFELHRFA